MAAREQVPTGVPGLDRLLRGGLPRSGLHTVVGRPGAGKSVLAHQVGAERIRQGGRVLYLTALVETHQTLIAQARSFSFFDPATVPDSFYYASLYPALARGGLPAAREEISRLAREQGPTLVVLDGVHALKARAESFLEYQRFMHELEAEATLTGAATLLLVHPERRMSSDPTFTIADGILHLATRHVRLRSVRMLAVEKLRGVGHVGGWHTFAITGDGVHVYPRLESLAAGDERHLDGDPPETSAADLVDFAVEDMHELTGGGLARDSVTLVVGTPGSGKTLLGLAFLAAAAEAEEPVLFLGFHEEPRALLQKADGVGLPLRRGLERGLVHLHWRAPTELLADDVAEWVLASIEEHGIRRVVVDAIEDVRQAIIPRDREVYFLAALATRLRRRGVASLFLQDLASIAGVNFDMPMPELSALMDNVLHTRYVEDGAELRRLVGVLKIRARHHDRSLREFQITPAGLRVGKAIKGSDTLLTGFASGRGILGH
ncbi:MAG TPA: ATPase domain-containing protein [Longimicrobiaceae bacterium]|nr:ATPase domain-containing protein [Longimicrobiaceae bacterium]